MNKKKNHLVSILFLSLLTIVVLLPIFFIFINSFKGKLFISDNPFGFPNEESFVGFNNYIKGIESASFIKAFSTSWYNKVIAKSYANF